MNAVDTTKPDPKAATPAGGAIKTDVLVIGAGSGGLSVAYGASQMGADVTLLEAHEMGATASTSAACRRRR